MKLDALDVALLRLLQGDGRLSFRELAAKTGSTTPTVSARLKALEDLGVVRGYRVDVNPDVLGGNPRLVTVRCRPSQAPGVAEALRRIEGVESVDILAGGSVLARVRTRQPHASPGDLHAALAALPDIHSYDVAEILATPMPPTAAVVAEGVEVPCHQCQGPIHGAPLRSIVDGRPHVFCCQHCLATFEQRFRKHTTGTPALPLQGRPQTRRRGHIH